MEPENTESTICITENTVVSTTKPKKSRTKSSSKTKTTTQNTTEMDANHGCAVGIVGPVETDSTTKSKTKKA